MTFGRSDSGWRGSRQKKARSLESGFIQIVRTVPFRGVVAGLVIGWPNVRNSWAVAWTAPSRSLLGQIPALDGDPAILSPPLRRGIGGSDQRRHLVLGLALDPP